MKGSNERNRFVAPTSTRVPGHTPENLNLKIARGTLENVRKFGSDAATIEKRLWELDREWDIERMLETNASTLVVLGVLLGYFIDAWFYWLPLLVGGFLLQHAIQGWCPPIRLFRRLGFRTHTEIATEHYALRALRGDFDNLPSHHEDSPAGRADRVLEVMKW